MHPKFRDNLRSVFNVNDLLPFFIGALTLTLIQDSLYKLLEDNIGRLFGKNVSPTLFIILLACIVLFVFVRIRASIEYRQNQLLENARMPTLHKQKPQRHKGLILLVSRIDVCCTAIEWHLPKLEYCWLICSERSLDDAQKLKKQFPKICSPALIVIDDVNDPAEFQTKIDAIYQQQLPSGWQETDIIADYTGMTAHASVGMALACLNTQRTLQYTPALSNPKNPKGKALGSADPIEIVLEAAATKAHRPRKLLPWFRS